MRHTVIVGGSHGGIQLADSLSAIDGESRITVVSDDVNLPYQRPPLSKEFLSAESDDMPLALRAEKFYQERGIDWQCGRSVVAIDREKKQIRAADGYISTYTNLVLATGARNRRLEIEGHDLNGVYYLRNLDQAVLLKSALNQAQRVVVVGAGFIGLEFVAMAEKRGLDVTVLELADRAMSRGTSAVISDYITRAHQSAGVKFRFCEGVAALRGEGGRVLSVVSADGHEYPADMVLIGIGVVPNADLAAESGLAVDDGIVVNEYLQTRDSSIWAIGDCTRFPDPISGEIIRIESVQNATDQAKCVAANIADSKSLNRYKEIPWFWSYQGRIKLQMVGHVKFSTESIVRGDIKAGRFSVFGFRGELLVSVESVNAAAHHMAARRILSRGIPLTPEQVANTEFDLKKYSLQKSEPGMSHV